MTNKRHWLLRGSLAVVAAALVIVGRWLDWWQPQPHRSAEAFLFADGFEDATSLDGLFPPDGSRWHGWQREPEGNVVELSSAVVHSGTLALRLHARPYDGLSASKADLQLGDLRFVKGDNVWFSGWFFLADGADASDLFLWDLEASSKYQSPGRRLFLQAGAHLASDLGKWWGAPTFRQPRGKEVPFPRNRWVELRVHLFLSEGRDGLMEVWQNGVKVLHATGQTLPTAMAIYNRMQVGITANGNRQFAHTLFIDDMVLSQGGVGLRSPRRASQEGGTLIRQIIPNSKRCFNKVGLWDVTIGSKVHLHL